MAPISSFFLPLLLLAAPLASALPLVARDEAPKEEVTDKFLFETPLADFLVEKANDAHDRRLIWTDDGCSSASSTPFDLPFLQACQRHDFGYDNYKTQDRFSEDNRKKLDENFKADLGTICAAVDDNDKKLLCEQTREVYYMAVRQFGNVDMTKLKETNDLGDLAAVVGQLVENGTEGGVWREGWESVKEVANNVGNWFGGLFGK